MVTIEITKSGVYNQKGEPIEVGTKLELEAEPRGWVNKYRVVSDDSGKELHTNDDGEPDGELAARYEEVLGKKPHPSMKAETMQAKIDEALDGSNDNS